MKDKAQGQQYLKPCEEEVIVKYLRQKRPVLQRYIPRP
jgi:hypothetical protein